MAGLWASHGLDHPAGSDDADAPADAGLGDAVGRHLASYLGAFADGLPPDGWYDRVLAEVEEPLLRLSLAATGGNQIRAARLLGINRNTLRKKLADHNVVAGRRGD